jgi:hypothetical protein
MLEISVNSAPFGREGAALVALVVALTVLVASPVAAASSAASATVPASSSGSTSTGTSGSGPHAGPVAPSPLEAAPDAGPSLSSPGVDPTAISLWWTEETNTPFENYSVEEASAASAWKLSVVETITTATSNSTVQSGLVPGAAYDWEVVENYETCVLGFLDCTQEAAATNLLNVSQPGVAFLNTTSVTSTTVTLSWTNNATYGGAIGFVEYQLFESKNGTPATAIESLTHLAPRSEMVGVLAGASYSFYLDTVDCTGGCGSDSPTTLTDESNVVTTGTLHALGATVFAERSTIDLGQSDLFTCTPSGGRSPFLYTWQFGSASPFVRGNATEGVVLAPAGFTTVTCEVNDTEPASAVALAGVMVYPPLVVAADVNRTSADVGQATGFTCFATGGDAPYTVFWSFGDGGSSIVGNTTHSFGVAADYAPYCQVSDPTGASFDPAFPLVVSPALAATASASSAAAAPGTSLQFTAAAVNGSGTYTGYSWSFPDGGTATGPTVAHAFDGTGTETSVLKITDSNGVTAATTISIDVSYVTATISAPTGSFHTGSSLSFAASASGGAGGPYNYTWTFGDGTTGYGAAVQHSYAKTGTMGPTLVVTDRLGGSNTTHLAALDLSAPPAPLTGFAAWLILGIGIIVAAIVGYAVLSRRRAADASELAASAAYVPPTDPKRTIQGRKVCPSCGATNLPIRSTCARCGKPLPRGQS